MNAMTKEIGKHNNGTLYFPVEKFEGSLKIDYARIIFTNEDSVHIDYERFDFYLV